VIVAREEVPVSQVRFRVDGIPQPAGSKRAFPFQRKGGGLGVRVTDDAKHGKGWRAEVAYAARCAYDGPPLAGPLKLSLVFTMPRPKGHYGTRGLRPSAPWRPIVKPDVLKLARLVEDACTGILWRDDSQIVEEVMSKHYGDRAGVEIRVELVSNSGAI
jgi:Holliday junction resolvase RusA-like endonuclease